MANVQIFIANDMKENVIFYYYVMCLMLRGTHIYMAHANELTRACTQEADRCWMPKENLLCKTNKCAIG